MRPDAGWQDDTNQERPPILKIVGRCVAGWLAGSLISLSYLQYFIWIVCDPRYLPAAGVIWGVAIGGILFAAVGSFAGASAYRPQALGIGAAIAATIAAHSMWSWFATPQLSHWSQAIAILVMAPAAQFAALSRRED